MEGHSIVENFMYKCQRRDNKYSKENHNDRASIYSKGEDSETQRSAGCVWRFTGEKSDLANKGWDNETVTVCRGTNDWVSFSRRSACRNYFLMKKSHCPINIIIKIAQKSNVVKIRKSYVCPLATAQSLMLRNFPTLGILPLVLKYLVFF